jgi:RNA polymerase sigma factor (sigma-70 family)
MASVPLGAVVRGLGRIFGAGTVAGLSEGQLLDRFLGRRDEAAFEALVARFGPMVLSVCRGLLRDEHDADDAFQATFLVLVKKGHTLRDKARLGNWLYGVAHRVASKARAQAARRRAREGSRDGEPPDVADTPDPRPPRPDALDDLGPLHEELARLPGRYREPVVLCYLQGQTHEEAARDLGCPVGTVKGRLSRARRLLHDRLVRRGVALGGGSALLALSRRARAAVPEALIRQTVKAAALAAGRGALAGTVPAGVAALAEGVMQSMGIAKLKLVAVAAVALGVVATGAGFAAQGFGGQGGPIARAKEGDPPTGPQAEVSKAPTVVKTAGPDPGEGDANPFGEGSRGPGEPRSAGPSVKTEAGASSPFPGLQVGAVEKLAWPPAMPNDLASLGPLGPDSIPNLDATAERRLQAAVQFLKLSWQSWLEGTITLDRYVSASQRLYETQRDITQDEAARHEALQAHGERMKALFERTERAYQHGVGSAPNTAEAELALAEAEYQLAHPAEKPRAPGGEVIDGGGFGGASDPEPSPPPRRLPDDPKTRAILAALDLPVAMPFGNETPLEDVIKYIKTATAVEGLPAGLPVFVDPNGLQLSGRTMASPIVLEMEGVPLRQTLALVLRQLELVYDVKGGLVVISSPDLIARVVPATGPGSPLPGGDHPGSRAIQASLDKEVEMAFQEETPLQDVVQFLQQATASETLPDGIPIYVDPVGLQEAEKTPQSPIQMYLKGVPLRRTLYLALRQLGLAYAVKDGVLYISTPDCLDEILIDSPVYETSELTRLQILNERGELSPEESERFKQLEQGETDRMSRQLNAQKRAGGFQ